MATIDPRVGEIEAALNWRQREFPASDVAYLLAELRKAREALADAWDLGVIHGHNADGRLIDKRDSNPYRAAVAAANGDGS